MSTLHTQFHRKRHTPLGDGDGLGGLDGSHADADETELERMCATPCVLFAAHAGRFSCASVQRFGLKIIRRTFEFFVIYEFLEFLEFYDESSKLLPLRKEARRFLFDVHCVSSVVLMVV